MDTEAVDQWNERESAILSAATQDRSAWGRSRWRPTRGATSPRSPAFDAL